MALPSFRVVMDPHGGPPPIEHFSVTAGQTFSAGDVVTLINATGAISEAADNAAVALGIALADAVDILAVTGATCPVALFAPGVNFSAVNTGTAYAESTRGDLIGLDTATSSIHSVNNTATGDLFTIVGNDADTDSGRILVTVADPANIQGRFGTAALT